MSLIKRMKAAYEAARANGNFPAKFPGKIAFILPDRTGKFTVKPLPQTSTIAQAKSVRQHAVNLQKSGIVTYCGMPIAEYIEKFDDLIAILEQPIED